MGGLRLAGMEGMGMDWRGFVWQVLVGRRGQAWPGWNGRVRAAGLVGRRGEEWFGWRGRVRAAGLVGRHGGMGVDGGAGTGGFWLADAEG